MTRYSRFVLGAVAAFFITGAATAQQNELHVYNWSDYIADDTIEKFEAETGINVTYDVYDSNEVLEAKLLSGNTGYDVVVPTSDFMYRQAQAGVYQKLDKSNLPNWEHLDEDILARLDASHDPDNQYAAPYMWGTTGIGYNINMVNERMPDAPTDSWAMMLDPDVVKNFADCGVALLDAPTEVFPATLSYLGMDPTGNDPENLEKALEHLLKIRPHIKYFHNSQNINDLANGDICMAMGWSGDMYIARDRAAEAGEGIEVDYVIPKEGALIWFDVMAIPADAPNPDNAHKFLDFIMRPEIAADITNYVWYASANSSAIELVDEEVTGDPAIYPPQEVKENLFPSVVQPQQYDRLMTRAFTRLKTGQ